MQHYIMSTATQRAVPVSPTSIERLIETESFDNTHYYEPDNTIFSQRFAQIISQNLIVMDNITNNSIPLYHNPDYTPVMNSSTNSKNKRSFNTEVEEAALVDEHVNIDAMDTASNVGLVSEQIKRCRITTSAGEILLRKEMKMYDDDNTNFSYSFTDEPNVVHLLFNDALSESAPNKFVVKVPKYYPHDAPTVTCLDMQGYEHGDYINSHGELTNIPVLVSWDALKSTDHVVAAIRVLREMIHDSTNMSQF